MRNVTLFQHITLILTTHWVRSRLMAIIIFLDVHTSPHKRWTLSALEVTFLQNDESECRVRVRHCSQEAQGYLTDWQLAWTIGSWWRVRVDTYTKVRWFDYKRRQRCHWRCDRSTNGGNDSDLESMAWQKSLLYFAILLCGKVCEWQDNVRNRLRLAWGWLL